MVDETFEEMLGGPAPDPNTRAGRREARRRAAALPAKTNSAGSDDELRLEHVMKGVSATWLAKMMRMDLAEVKRRLSVVTPMSGAKNQAKYDLKTVMPHLVDPITDIEDYLKNLDPKNLPPKLSAAFWAGMKTRLQTMEQAKQLWPTSTVVEAFGEVFKILRSQTSLWADTVDENHSLSEDQRRMLLIMVDSLAGDILGAMKQFAETNATRSEVQWLEEYERDQGG